MDRTNLPSAQTNPAHLAIEVESTTIALRKGHVILFPTDTIWGIGCDATNEAAIERICFIKRRERTRPFILLVDGIPMLKEFITTLHPRIETLLVYHTKPLTLIYKNPKNIHSSLLSKEGTVAIRICHDPFCSAVIEQFGRPIVATSANISGEPYPVSFDNITLEIKSSVDHICHHRQTEIMETPPSVVARYNNKGDLDFIRE